ncbi:transporter substrate-binding domain-containing protein [Aestuariibius insulae]|uniref:transporter substrate-binding domain-containing protein n=1 Tax=Aestuariibius insulae TaxID=2058287 RepID=UPI00345E8FAB
MTFAYIIEPPFNYHNESGTLAGCDIDLARHVFKQINDEEFAPVQTEFADLLPGLTRGDWQMTTGLFSSEERSKIATFTRPIWALPDGLLVPEGNPHAITGYRSLAKTANGTLAVIRDQIQHRTARDLGLPESRITAFETYEDAAAAVENGTVSAYASVARAHAGFLAGHPDKPLEVVAVPSSEKAPAYGAFAVALSRPDLLDRANEILSQYLGSPDHRRMMAGYGFTDAEIDLVSPPHNRQR